MEFGGTERCHAQMFALKESACLIVACKDSLCLSANRKYAKWNYALSWQCILLILMNFGGIIWALIFHGFLN